MTEVEKLRALLAEARAITQDSLDSNATGFEADDEVCKCNACERYRSIITRIDAALAEPVSECVDCAQERAEYDSLAAQNRLLHRERDEARAEVNMLRILLGQSARNERLWRQREQKWLPTLNAARTHAEEAFKRGAEAMRAAAASVANKQAALTINTPVDAAWGRSAACIEDDIRALPLPEDK